ncbi:MAG: endolytic transglycosylase MltG [Candidatus Dojkabacteria bacterium]|nr:MAG: endolytic transglycosylase MltG [Candidatus Dojkabacteria bacterium]
MASYSTEKIRPQKSGKKGPIILLGLLILILALAGGTVFALDSFNIVKIQSYSCYWDYGHATEKLTPEGMTEQDKVPLLIESGDTVVRIGQKLQEKGLVSSPEYFACYVKKTSAGEKIQAGYFELPVPISVEQLVPLLQTAKVPSIRITIKEGLRLDEIADIVDAALSESNPIKAFNKEEFLALTVDTTVIENFDFMKGKSSLEGILFPDTYDIPKNADSKAVIDLLTSTFQRKVLNQLGGTLSVQTLSTYDVITLASIIEKEAGSNFEEKQMVADILLRRLRDGWLLQVDATFMYEHKDWKHVITVQDKATNTPYNTYLRKGLPPTPINNPGLDSIRAALTPKSNQYWYYLHGTDGQIRYGVTYDDHLRNISTYLRP